MEDSLDRPFGPPRPRAIATILTSDDFLPGVQTLLLSVKENLPFNKKNNNGNKNSSSSTSKAKAKNSMYPPDIIVLITPNISQAVRDALYPTFCTRLITVEPIPIPSISGDSSSNLGEQNTTGKSHVQAWDDNCGYTKLHIFGHSSVTVYEKILYIDSDCLVIQDISNLLLVGSKNNARIGLEAASPDIFPPDKFNAGVMVISPSKETFDDMLKKTQSLESYDGGDTGFLNAYYSNWYTHMPTSARLPFAYNAQRFMFHCTYQKQPKYWDVGIGDDLSIIHFSSAPKPWQRRDQVGGQNDMPSPNNTNNQVDLLCKEDFKRMAENVDVVSKLDILWTKAYERSKVFAKNEMERQREKEARQEKEDQSRGTGSNTRNSVKRSGNNTQHSLITKRFKELRKSGCSMKDAMAQARNEYGMDDDRDDPGKKVAAMFGMPL